MRGNEHGHGDDIDDTASHHVERIGEPALGAEHLGCLAGARFLARGHRGEPQDRQFLHGGHVPDLGRTPLDPRGMAMGEISIGSVAMVLIRLNELASG